MAKDLSALRIDPDKKRNTDGNPKKWLLILVVLFVSGVLALFAFQALRAPVDEATALRTSDSGATSSVASSAGNPVAKQDQAILITSGYIVPHHRIEVGSKILGKVSWVGVEKSDRVQKGQLLVKLDDREIRAQLDQAKASQRAALARLSELESGSRPEEIQRAQAELERNRADLENARLELKRLEALADSRIISAQLVDNARSRFEMAEAAVRVAEKNHELLRIGPRSETIESARAEAERTAASVEYWQSQLAETEIRAPIQGTVLERVAEVGEMVSTSFAGGATVVALADLNDLQVELDISQSDFHKIDPEQQCRMSPVAFPDREYRCEIAEIAPEANRQRATIQVKVKVFEPDEFLRPEMDARVTFSAAASDRENAEPKPDSGSS